MDSVIWNRLRLLSNEIENIFDQNLARYENPKLTKHFDGWTDKFWKSESIRKAHLKIIEPGTEGNKKLWLLHINVFPQPWMNLPILGFDIVSGPNKISGSFMDYSPVSSENHSYMEYFAGLTSNLSWKKERELPEWALEIFSPNIVAAGGIDNENELEQFCKVGLTSVSFYMNGITSKVYRNMGQDFLPAQNKYCHNQKKNVQLHRSILSMGISEEDKNDYVNNVLFEEL